MTYVESKLSGEVVHATGMHQAQCVPHCLRAQHALVGDRANAAIGQCGCHDTGTLTGHLDGAELKGDLRLVSPQLLTEWRSYCSSYFKETNMHSFCI